MSQLEHLYQFFVPVRIPAGHATQLRYVREDFAKSHFKVALGALKTLRKKTTSKIHSIIPTKYRTQTIICKPVWLAHFVINDPGHGATICPPTVLWIPKENYWLDFSSFPTKLSNGDSKHFNYASHRQVPVIFTPLKETISASKEQL